MKRSGLYRHSLGRFGVLGLAFGLVLFAMSSSAFASCGDYLLHGPMVDSTQDASQFWRLFDEQPQPHSACEGGRCQSQPIPPPLDPWRVTIPKPTLLGVLSSDQQAFLLGSAWARPRNGSRADSPFYDVASPPPRLCFLFA